MINTSQTFYLQHISTIYFVLCSVVASAQSLPEQIQYQLKNTNEIIHDSLYYELVKHYRSSDIVQAKRYAAKSNALAIKYKHPLVEARSLYALAWFSKELNSYDSALYFYQRGLTVSKVNGFHDRIIYFYNDIGSLYEILDQYDSALINYLHAMETAKQYDKPHDEAIAFNNIGLIYLRLENYAEAITYLESAIAVKRANNILEGIEININNLAVCYTESKLYAQSEQVLREVIAGCAESNSCETENLLNAYFNLGDCLFRQGKFDEAKEFLTKCYQQSKPLNFPRLTSNSLLLLGVIECKKGLDCEAKLIEATQIAESARLKRLMRDGYHQLALYYERSGNLANSIKYKNQYIAVKDSIFNEAMANNLRQIQVDAQRKEAMRVISQKDSELQRSRMINLLLGLTAILFGLLIFFIYRIFLINRRMKNKLEIEVGNRTSELRKSNQELKRSQKEYDHLIYRTSHDIRGPLSTLIGLTNLAKIEAEPGQRKSLEPAIMLDYLSKIERTANGLNSVLSKLLLVNTVRNQPLHLSTVNLVDFIKEIIQEQVKFDYFPLIKTQVHAQEKLGPISTDAQLLEIILTTIIENAFVYYNANRTDNYVRVNIEQTADVSIIHIMDNGIGIMSEAKDQIFDLFFVASERHGAGVGLFLAQSAIERLDGLIKLSSLKNPTHFTVVIPNELKIPAQPENNNRNVVAAGRLMPLTA